MALGGDANSTVRPAFGAGLGYSFPLGSGASTDFSPSFNVAFLPVKNRTWLDLNLAYRLPLFSRK